MPKYWVKNYFAHGRFPEVGQKQKMEKREKKRRPKVFNNNGQLHIATPPRVAHVKPPRLILCVLLSVAQLSPRLFLGRMTISLV